MQISAAMVKELRERTGAGMMECKKALTEAGGDMEAAADQMRISGLAKADKKSGNTAAEGVVSIKLSDDGKRFAIVEINSQTDFAAKATDFIGFVDSVTTAVLNDSPADVDSIKVNGEAVEEVRKSLVAKIGENIQVRRFATGETRAIWVTTHTAAASVLWLTWKAAMPTWRKVLRCTLQPLIRFVSPKSDVPAALLAKEKEILMAEAAESGKPAEIIEKMVQGKIRKYLAEVTLVGQPYVKDPDQTVAALLKAAGASVKAFHRLEVGEGIEKKEENFADEVMAQVRDAETDAE